MLREHDENAAALAVFAKDERLPRRGEDQRWKLLLQRTRELLDTGEVRRGPRVVRRGVLFCL